MTAALDAFRQVVEAAGLRPGEIIADGVLHRCPVDGKPQGRDGAYVLYLDAPASGWWQNFRTGEQATWTAKEEHSLSPEDRKRLQARIEVDRRQREEDAHRRHAEAAEKARGVIAGAAPCTEHPYLAGKGVKPCPGLLLSREKLIVPLHSPEDNKIVSLQFIPPDGRDKRLLTGGRKKGCFFAIRGQDGPLYICEGLATGLSIWEAVGHTVLVAFDCGNLAHVAAHARQKYPGREIVLCADDDRATDGNPGLTAATAAARSIDGLLAVPSFKEPLDASGKARTDFNDLHQAGGLAVVKTQLAAAQKPVGGAVQTKGKQSTGSALGNSFSLRDSGVFFMELDKDDNPEWHWVCSPLRILARTRNADGQAWGHLLEVLDPEGNAHRWAMPSTLMAGCGDAYRAELLSLGLSIAPGLKGKQRLDLYLSTAKVDGLALCVDRIGWCGGAFVLPDAVYGEQAGELIVPQGIPSENPFRQRGSLEEWRIRVGRVCAGNSRLVLAVAAALAAPLLEPLGAESGGLHLVGGSSLGKTTALRLAGSVCGGGPSGFIKQWRATDNGLESIAAAHCDALLCLDEMGQAGSKVVSEVAYMLANGSGKGRASRDGQSRKPHTWRVLFLSTGEVTLSDKVMEDGRGRAKAGQAVRVVDIPADAGAGLGLFETLHGCESADLFARQLKEASSCCYGTPLRAFLQSFVADRDTLTRQVQKIMRTFEADNCPEGVDGQVRRVCGRFALVAAAGELGVSLGVLPWPEGEASRSAATCFHAWIEQRGGTGAAEVTAGLEQVRRFFQAHGAARFEDLDSQEPRTVINRAGYRRRENGEAVFMVFPEVFRQEVCSGFNHKMLGAELGRRGFMEMQSPHQTRKLRNPAGRFYIVRAAILSGDSGDSGDMLEPQRFEPSPVVETPSGDSGDTMPLDALSLASVPSVPSVPSGDFAEWGRREVSNTNDVPSVPSVPNEKSTSATICPSAAPNSEPLPDVVTI